MVADRLGIVRAKGSLGQFIAALQQRFLDGRAASIRFSSS
jgi:hypothetical protein